jgi:hypothetical protein
MGIDMSEHSAHDRRSCVTVGVVLNCAELTRVFLEIAFHD